MSIELISLDHSYLINYEMVKDNGYAFTDKILGIIKDVEIKPEVISGELKESGLPRYYNFFPHGKSLDFKKQFLKFLNGIKIQTINPNNFKIINVKNLKSNHHFSLYIPSDISLNRLREYTIPISDNGTISFGSISRIIIETSFYELKKLNLKYKVYSNYINFIND